MEDKVKKRTKRNVIEDLCTAESELEWLEYSCIPNLKKELSKYKLTKKEIQEYSLEEFIDK